MRFIIVYSLLVFSVVLAPSVYAQSTMTDQQVLEYVQQGVNSGKSQNQIMKELVLRGVDRAQVERLKKLYNSQKSDIGDVGREDVWNATSRAHTLNTDQWGRPDTLTKSDARLSDKNYVSEDVFGRNIFRNNNLSLSPSSYMPTPKNYVLGPGDEVIVDIFGANQSTIRSEISPEGYINVDVLGPLYLNGKSIEAANKYLKTKLAKIYEGLSGGDDQTDIQLSLGQVRSIQINVLGEVVYPGTYLVSSLSTVFHAMFKAGGIQPLGTVRDIKVVRQNKTIATIDLYDLLINGARTNDVRLEDDDVILVGTYNKIVRISGNVKRPMRFEMRDGETVADLLSYAGGFSKSAFEDEVTVVRQVGKDSLVVVVQNTNFNAFVLQDGDRLLVKNVGARFENRLFISGSVKMPGVFELEPSVNSVRKLVIKAGGLQPEAFTQRALIHRKHEDLSLETFAIDLEGIMNGTKPDVPLQKEDSIYVNSVFDLNDRGTLTINGEVAFPGTFPFAANTTVQDLILQAGGLLRSASVARVDVARLIIDNESLVAQKDIAAYYSFSVENGFAVDGADEFLLEPYDVVTVRRSPSYVENKVVAVTGEVNFPGNYSMSRREERVSDLVAKAGNITDFAYVKGARLKRALTRDDIALRDMLASAVRTEVDSVAENLNQNYYDVSFDLEDALKHPGGENDIVLREGDILSIPVYKNTVSISGAVQMPTTLTYNDKLNKAIVVNAAGGYAKRAYKRKAFIVYMNGRVARLKRFTKIEPGSMIYIPKKEKKEGQLQQIMGISTTAASLGMMGVSIANLLK